MSLVSASTPFCLPADARNCIIRWWRRPTAALTALRAVWCYIHASKQSSGGSSSSGRPAGWLATSIFLNHSVATCCCRLTWPALAYSAGCIRGDGWRLSGRLVLVVCWGGKRRVQRTLTVSHLSRAVAAAAVRAGGGVAVTKTTETTDCNMLSQPAVTFTLQPRKWRIMLLVLECYRHIHQIHSSL